MNGDDENEDLLEGTTERKIEIVRVGNRIIKTSIYEEQTSDEGILEKRNLEEKTPLDCGHTGKIPCRFITELNGLPPWVREHEKGGRNGKTL